MKDVEWRSGVDDSRKISYLMWMTVPGVSHLNKERKLPESDI
jgi:hypothetical protein